MTRPADANPSPPPIEYAPTEDGARIAIKRKPAAGAPVIFVHGLAVNADLWDVPPINGPDFSFRGLPTVLHDAGHDVWLMNLRGCGAPTMLSEPPAGMTDWCVDHFILYDLPAVVKKVRESTGRQPFIIGNSMGSMTTAGWLQGARLVAHDTGGQAASGTRASGTQHIEADAETARARQQEIVGAILVEFPAALRWPKSLYDAVGRFRWRDLLAAWRERGSDVNYPFEMLSRMTWLQAIIESTGGVRLDWLRPKPDAPPWWESLPKPIADSAKRMNDSMIEGLRVFAKRWKGVQNFSPETFVHGLLPSADHMKAGVLKQMGASVRAGAFLSGLGEPPHVYSDHYDLIESPTLVIAGGEDRIANAEVTREVFFDQIASPDKTFRNFDSLAHGDFEFAPVAAEEVYPLIRQWIADRDSAADSP